MIQPSKQSEQTRPATAIITVICSLFTFECSFLEEKKKLHMRTRIATATPLSTGNYLPVKLARGNGLCLV